MTEARHIVLFDGVCNLCNASVQFLLKRDRKQRLHFASLQSEAASELLRRHNYPQGADLNSIVFIDGEKVYTESTAVLRICRYLGFPWNWMQAFLIVPVPVRDAVYRWIARNRYRWFGKKDQCMLPEPGVAARFL